jgi:hypothetical protein
MSRHRIIDFGLSFSSIRDAVVIRSNPRIAATGSSDCCCIPHETHCQMVTGILENYFIALASKIDFDFDLDLDFNHYLFAPHLRSEVDDLAHSPSKKSVH